MSRKTIIILRHGQAKNAGITEHDHNRALTIRGVEEAQGVGNILVDNDLTPDYVLCSTATRTRETLAELQKSFPESLPVTYSQKIYNASEIDLINQVAIVPDNTNKLLLIGHNPGLYQLALALAKGGDKQMHNELQMQFPTCALVVINFEGEWRNIMHANSKLALFTTPQKQIMA